MHQKQALLTQFSNIDRVRQNAKKYFGHDKDVYISTRKNKKYMIADDEGRMIHFGSFSPPMEDYTKHKNEMRRKNYLNRATQIKGDWKLNKYSPNNLAIHLLWN